MIPPYPLFVRSQAGFASDSVFFPLGSSRFCLGYFPVYLGIRIPRLSAIFVFFSLMAIAYLIRCHHFLQPEENDPDSVILAGTTRTHIYFIFCLATAAFSILNLFLSPSASPLPISFFLLAVTLYLLIVYLVPTGGAFKEMWPAICISFVIPVISLWSSQTGNSTIWVFVFAFMLGSLLSNRLTFLGTSVVFSLLTQVFIWFHQSVAFADLSPFTYIPRLLLLTWFTALSSYVYSIYVRRLRENVALTFRKFLCLLSPPIRTRLTKSSSPLWNAVAVSSAVSGHT